LPRPDGMLTRRLLLQGASALAGGAVAFRSGIAQSSRPDIILLGPLSDTASLQVEGFTFANFLGDYPFWTPSWLEVLSGRPLGRGAAMPERDTLATVFAANGYDTALVAGEVVANLCARLGFASVLGAGEYPRRSGQPSFLVVLGEVELDAAAFVSDDSVLVGLPPLGPISGGRRRPAPLVICYRSGVGSSDVPMNPLDIAPTVCGLAGVPRPAALVGRDYSALVARPRALAGAVEDRKVG
jgi:hypothetical protein